jgi:methyl-accepting chemotaxis protein PixJ
MMTPEESLTLSHQGLAATPSEAVSGRSLWQRIQSALQAQLVTTITAALLLGLALTGTSAWNIWRIYQGLQTTVAKQFKLQDLSGQIIHLDEVLTMSARMAASTGNRSWEDRYNDYVPKLDLAIGEMLKEVPVSEQANPEQTDAANKKLIEMETQAFQLVGKGQSPAALKLLLGPQYAQQKAIYSTGINATLTKVKTDVAVELKEYRMRLLWSVIFAVTSVLLLAVLWAIVLQAVRGYIRERNTSQAALLTFQTNLTETNAQLLQESQQRLATEQQIREESELLQADIAHILDVVSALEEGDLTVQAAVSDRATGLVSDTLNRLSESLNTVISAVVSTTGKVAANTEAIEQIAAETATQARHQATSVEQVQSLMRAVSELTADSRQQALNTDEAVQLARSAVSDGQQEMGEMVTGIATLNEGTDRIVKRTQTLNDFVELAAKFSKDQKRIATLTRVLALNASTLSSRALKEQNPTQFASIAREFESIARQVNELAVTTNSDLLVLQQRTDQIQTVTSGLKEDVSDISGLVQQFTTGVSHSRQVFDNIQLVTERVAQAGQQVNLSSENIVRAVSDVLEATTEIATITQDTEAKANLTRAQVESMGQLANVLMDMVEFFRVHATTNTVASAHPPTLVTEVVSPETTRSGFAVTVS